MSFCLFFFILAAAMVLPGLHNADTTSTDDRFSLRPGRKNSSPVTSHGCIGSWPALSSTCVVKWNLGPEHPRSTRGGKPQDFAHMAECRAGEEWPRRYRRHNYSAVVPLEDNLHRSLKPHHRFKLFHSSCSQVTASGQSQVHSVIHFQE